MNERALKYIVDSSATVLIVADFTTHTHVIRLAGLLKDDTFVN